jgi:bloom syndrome protein
MDDVSVFNLDNPVSTAPSNAAENITSRYFPPAAIFTP